MDRLYAIELFVRLVECGSFSAVGRLQEIGQPAVSRQIAALERHLGVQLVLRTSRQVVITEAGLTFYEAAKQLVDDYDAVETSVGQRQQSPRGVVRLNTAPGHGRLCITPLLTGFFQRYPEVTVELSVSGQAVDLVSEGIDLAVRHGQLLDSSLTAKKLGETHLVLVATPAYLAAHGTPHHLADLDAHNCVVFARGRERRPWAFKQRRDAVAYMPHGSVLTGDAEQVRTAVLCGLGLAQVPHWLLAAEIESGEAQLLLPELQADPLPINLVYPAGRRVPKRVRVLIDYLVEATGAR